MSRPLAPISPTGRIRRVLTPLGKGSDYYGPCEVCGKGMSEAFKHYTQEEARRHFDGSLFHFTGPGAYGHRECLIARFGAPT